MAEFKGYEHAATFDTWLTDKMKDYPLSKETAKQWMIFARTVRTSMDILNRMAYLKLTGKQLPEKAVDE